jgi:site-specific DNA-methyltransferase (adenine-specific)
MNWIDDNTKFVFKQFIVWNKRFDGVANKGFLDGFVETGGLRNYQQMAEYCLFYTFQDDTGLTTVMLDTNNFSTLRGYFKALQEYIGFNKKRVLDTIGQNADHCFRWGSSQWDLPTKETYQQLIDTFHIDQWQEFRTYESLRLEYESLRYTFNNQKTHHSVWNYEIAERIDHATPKPIDLIKNIITHSSNVNDLILDPFLGSGTTCYCANKLNRKSIGIELSEKYCEIAKNRLAQQVMKL